MNTEQKEAGLASDLNRELEAFKVGDEVNVQWIDDDEDKSVHILDDGVIVSIFKCLWTGSTMYVFESTHAEPHNWERFKILSADKLKLQDWVK